MFSTTKLENNFSDVCESYSKFSRFPDPPCIVLCDELIYIVTEIVRKLKTINKYVVMAHVD